MSALLLYEIYGEPRSAYLNAIELPNIDHRREIFLTDILQYLSDSPVGCNFTFYAVIKDRLVWLDAPTCLVPICPDGIIRMVLKPASVPPFIHLKQYEDFADKSRIQFYSRSDYLRTGEYAYRTFHETGRVVSQYLAQRAQARAAAKATTKVSAEDLDHFFPSQLPADPWATTGQNGNSSAGADQQQFDSFADFEAHFEAAPAVQNQLHREHDRQGRPPKPEAYSDQAERAGRYTDNHRERDRPARRAEREAYEDEPGSSNYRPSKYNLDHSGSKHSASGAGGGNSNSNNNETNLNSIVGDETAAVLTEAVEAAGVAAKNFFSFASNLGKSVFEMAQAGAAQGAAAVVNSGPPGKLQAGNVVQVGRMAVTVVKDLAEGGFGMVYLVENSSRSGQQFALKQLLCQSREQIAEAHNELDTLRRFQGRSGGNIIELLEFTAAGGGSAGAGGGGAGPKQVLMLFPLYPLGTLWDSIADGTQAHVNSWPFPEHVALYIVMCAAEALLVLHKEGLAHRDVKPHNFLLESLPGKKGISPVRPVLMDLGSVTAARIQVRNKREALNLEEEAACKTSAAYRSPELTSPPFPPFQVDERVDTWGLGCTMYCIAFGRSPFETTKEGVLRLAILNGRYSTPAGNRNKDCTYSEDYMQLIERMLKVDIAERPYVEEVIRTCQGLLARYS